MMCAVHAVLPARAAAVLWIPRWQMTIAGERLVVACGMILVVCCHGVCCLVRGQAGCLSYD